MENSFTQRYTFKTLMCLSLILGLIFFYTNHIDFISASMEYGKMNIPNIGYIFLRMFGGIFIPAVLIVPSMFEFGRIKLARIGFIAYGICHLITVSWVIYFLVSQPAISIFSQGKVTDFLSEGGFVYTIAFWDNYSLVSVFFAIIYGITAIYTGINFDKDKSTVKALVSMLFAIRIFLPLVFNILVQGRIFSLFWLTNNALELASQLLFTVGIVLAGADNYTWIELVWDQIAFSEPETDEQDTQE